MTQKIAIIAGHDGKKITTATWELFAFAQKLADSSNSGSDNTDICFYLIGENTREGAEEISFRSGCPVIAADVPGTRNYQGPIFKKTLLKLFSKNTFNYIIAPHNTSGMDYAPAISLGLGGTCMTAVEDVKEKEGSLLFLRSMYGGKIQARMEIDAPLAILTLAPGAFKPVQPEKNSTADVSHIIIDTPQAKMTYIGSLPSPSQGSNLAKAEVIVAGGRGIEEEENYQFIEQLADIFPRAATGASRPICDYGWVKYSQQVGATGTIVAPKLYIACGISGSTQHLEGIRDSRFIIAINSDPDAPILQVADVCIIEDLTEFIPIVVEAYKNRKRPAN